jgi:hypothetical protein
MPTNKGSNWIKPLKRSQKVRIRKEIDKRRKQAQIFHEELQGGKWELTWEQCDWKSSGLSFGGKSRITEDGWEYKLL